MKDASNINRTYDVVVFDRATHQVVQIYSRGLSAIEAQKMFKMNLYSLGIGYEMDVVESGLFAKGDEYK